MKKKLKKRKTHDLRLTKFELLHLRDLFSVVLGPDAKRTVSQTLAEAESRPMVETFLWKKLSALLEKAEVPTGDDAPDFVVASTETPHLSVFQLATEPTSQQDKSEIFQEEE